MDATEQKLKALQEELGTLENTLEKAKEKLIKKQLLKYSPFNKESIQPTTIPALLHYEPNSVPLAHAFWGSNISTLNILQYWVMSLDLNRILYETQEYLNKVLPDYRNA